MVRHIREDWAYSGKGAVTTPGPDLSFYVTDNNGKQAAFSSDVWVPRSGSTSMRGRLDYPLTVTVGAGNDDPWTLNYNGNLFTKDGTQSNSACTVGGYDDPSHSRQSDCWFQC